MLKSGSVSVRNSHPYILEPAPMRYSGYDNALSRIHPVHLTEVERKIDNAAAIDVYCRKLL